jgi:DNA (cytosine-5)-methyltransferase 3A
MKLEKFQEQSYQDILVNGYAHCTEKKARTLLSNGVTLTNGIFRKFKMNIGNIIFKDEETSKLPVEEILEMYPSVLEASGYKGHAGSATDPYKFYNDFYRIPSVEELESLMCICPGHVSNVKNVSKTEKQKAIGLSFTVSVVAGLLKSLPIINK